jgi:hypothetical protein
MAQQHHTVATATGLAAPQRSSNPQKQTPPDGVALQGGCQQNEQRDFAIGADFDKAFLTLRAMLALKNYGLSRTHSNDGPVRFHVTRWGMVRELPDIAAVSAFAAQVGAVND